MEQSAAGHLSLLDHRVAVVVAQLPGLHATLGAGIRKGWFEPSGSERELEVVGDLGHGKGGRNRDTM